MSEPAAAVPSARRFRAWRPRLAADSAWRVTWSVPAAMRAVRATIVVPGLFALTFKVIGDVQMTVFATFGGFATLIFANFGGTRRDKLTAHFGLAVTGSLALIIGTLVSGSTWLATLVTIPVAFAIFFAGVVGPNAASGVSGALLGYVLPVASAGGAATIPSRLAGWWLASAAGTAAVLLLSPKSPGDRLRASASAAAAALSRHLHAAVRGEATRADRDDAVAAKHKLMETFAGTPYRPTGLATADQAMANVVQELEWSAVLAGDAMDGHVDLSLAAAADRDLLGVAADVLGDTAALLDGAAVQPDFGRLEAARAASAAHQAGLSGDRDTVRTAAAHAFHAQTIAVAARTAAADALIATRRADPETIAAERRGWYGESETGPPKRESRLVALVDGLGVVSRHASFRSVWFLNATRGAVALAVAVAVADLTGVQHGFWVVLGTMSVLRTSAASTGSTAWRALAGTAVGFAVGAALLAAIGTGPVALWVALPIAVCVATYAPGTAPFLVGQAAFTVTVVVLFNLLAPAGWRIGLLRIQDVALGCAVSLVIGILFWPHGAAAVVGDDLADAFRRGSAYLTQAVDWALGLRPDEPDTAVAAATAGLRLDDALRGFLAEQGSKRLSKDDLWHLVMATMRLRLTAHSLAGLRGTAPRDGHPGEARTRLQHRAEELAGFYGQVAAQLGHPGPPGHPGNAGQSAHDGNAGHLPRVKWPLVSAAAPAGRPALEPMHLAHPAAAVGRPALEPVHLADPAAAVGPPGESSPGAIVAEEDVAMAENLVAADTVAVGDALREIRPQFLWVHEHLQHLSARVHAISAPATRLAELRQQPWWR